MSGASEPILSNPFLDLGFNREVFARVPSEAGVELISVDFQGDTVVSIAFQKAVDGAIGEFVQAELLLWTPGPAS